MTSTETKAKTFILEIHIQNERDSDMFSEINHVINQLKRSNFRSQGKIIYDDDRGSLLKCLVEIEFLGQAREPFLEYIKISATNFIKRELANSCTIIGHYDCGKIKPTCLMLRRL